VDYPIVDSVVDVPSSSVRRVNILFFLKSE
jgi:hypothetical protein